MLELTLDAAGASTPLAEGPSGVLVCRMARVGGPMGHAAGDLPRKKGGGGEVGEGGSKRSTTVIMTPR